MENRSDWGKINDRQPYNILVQDFDRALQWAGLGVYEAVLFEQARELGWHEAIKGKGGRNEQWPDPRPVRLNIHGLAKATKTERRRWTEAKRELLDSRMFLAGPEGSVWINKHADQWIYPATGRPRLAPEILEWCAQARRKTQGRLPLEEGAETGDREAPRGGGIPPPQGGRNSAQGEGAKPPRKGALNRPGGGRQTAPPHIEERTRGDLKKSSLDVCAEGNGPVPGVTGADPDTHTEANLSGIEEADFRHIEALVASYRAGSNGTLDGSH